MGAFDDLLPEEPKSKGGLFDDLVPASDKVTRYKEGLRKAREGGMFPGLSNTTRASSGLLGSIVHEAGAATLAGIDTLTGDAQDWNQRRIEYRKAMQDDREEAKQAVGGAAIPLELAAGIGYGSALPLVGKMPPMLQSAGGFVSNAITGARNVVAAAPTMAKTGAVYGGLAGALDSQGDDIGSRASGAGHQAVEGAILGPLVHGAITSTVGTGRAVREGAGRVGRWMTGTTDAERASMQLRRQDLNAAGVRDNEIYGPYLRDEPSALEAMAQRSLGGYYPTKQGADRHVNALARETDNVLGATGAPRARPEAAQVAQETVRNQLNDKDLNDGFFYSRSNDELAKISEPITGGRVRPPGPNSSGGGGQQPGNGGGGGGGGPAPTPNGPSPAPKPARQIAAEYQNAKQIREEKKLPHPEDYFSDDEANALQDMWQFSRQKLETPERLINWIIRNGGVKDPSGDVTGMLGKANMRPGLINNKSGLHPDEMSRKAWEEGFIQSKDRPDINTLYEHMHRDHSGDHVVRTRDNPALDDLLLQQQFKNELAQHGINARTEQEALSQIRRPQQKTGPRSSKYDPVAEEANIPSATAGQPLNPEFPRRPFLPESENPGPPPRFLQPTRPPGPLTTTGEAGAPPLFPPGRGGRSLPPPDMPPPASLPPPSARGLPPPPNPGAGNDRNYTDRERIAAMYELVKRSVPGEGQGGWGTARQSHQQDRNLNYLFATIRRNARSEGRLPNDDPRIGILDSPAAEDIRREAQRYLPRDLVTSYFNRETPRPSIGDIRSLRTKVRQADTGQTNERLMDETYLPRAEAALTQDLHARLERIPGPALENNKAADDVYKMWMESHVKKLREITRSNISPETAFNSLQSAMQGKNAAMLRAYVAANQRAGTAQDGVGVLVSHMMEGSNARTALEGFQKAYGKITPGAKTIMAQGDGRPLINALDRLHELSTAALNKSGGQSFGLGWKGHGVIGIATLTNHFLGAAQLVGGQYLLGRVLASPAYVNWLTRAARIQATPGLSRQWQAHVAKLTAIAESDGDTGKQVLKAFLLPAASMMSQDEGARR